MRKSIEYRIPKDRLIELLICEHRIKCKEKYNGNKTEYLAETIGVELEDVCELKLDYIDAARESLSNYEKAEEKEG